MSAFTHTAIVPSVENLEVQVQAILERNARVEAEKEWEVSLCRRFFIFCSTYLIACIFLWVLGIPYFYLQALLPTGGYLLSTLSLPWAKRFWLEHYYRVDTTQH